MRDKRKERLSVNMNDEQQPDREWYTQSPSYPNFATETNIIKKITALRYADEQERKELLKEIFSLIGDEAVDKLYIAFTAHDNIFLCLLLISIYDGANGLDTLIQYAGDVKKALESHEPQPQ